MRLDVVEVLRCPRAHAESSLVVRIDAAVDREIVTGMLVCPVCEARFAIADGAVVMDDAAAKPSGEVPAEHAVPPSADEVLRVAAFLGLTEPGELIVLAGSAARYATGLADLAQAEIVLLDPPASADATVGTPLYGPAGALARSSVKGAVAGPDGARFLEGIVLALRSPTRLLAAASLPVPVGVRELARDREWWVAERMQVEPTVQLRGRRPRNKKS